MTSSLFLVFLALLVPAAFLAIVPPARAAASAVIQNDSMWIDSIGTLHIVGEVRNSGAGWLTFVEVTGTLRDSGNAIVDVVFTFTSLRYVPPNIAAPFDLMETDTAKSARVQSYTLLLDYQESPEVPQKLVVMNAAQSTNSLGWLEIVGEVQNNADAVSAYTEVTGTFYDAQGKVAYVGFTFTSPSEIPAGAISPFKLSIIGSERSSKVAQYTLFAESTTSGFTSTPETPWPGIFMAVVLAVGVVALRRKRA